MKKFLSLVVSLSLILSFSSAAFATNNNENSLYVPSPSEIHEIYEQLSATRTSKEAMIEFVLSDSSSLSERPLLQLGVLSSFAEAHDDLNILIAASSIVTEEIIPNLTANDYISLLANDDYTDAFKFSIIDAYSYSDESLVTRDSATFSLVDEKLVSFILPNSDLSIIAFFTAVDLTNNSIGYTLFNLFTTSLSSGTISPSDINKMRCDGVVEYSYEYNGIKVLGDSTNWNCSTVSGLNAHSGLPKAQSRAFNCTY